MSLAPYNKLVDDIRMLLSSDADPLEDELFRLDNQYVEAVREVNRRLRECESLMQSGHRGEALQRCEIEPNLIDFTGIIDFPEREMWVDYLSQFALPAPPEPLTEVAAELSGTYVAEASLDELKRKNRLHALARSPLRVRINIMRTIAKADKDNPLWIEDIRTFERARHGELRAELDHHIKTEDVSSLARLEQDLFSKHWLQSPPQDICEQTRAAHTRLRIKHTRVELEKIEQDLTQAHSNFDVEKGRQLRSLWHSRAAIGIESDDDPLLELVAPAMDWLASQDQEEQASRDFQTAIAELEYALDNSAERDELERLYYAACRFDDRDVPETLKSRLSERLRSIEVARSRKSRLVIACSVLAILLVAALVGVFVVAQQRAAVVADHAESLEQLIESEKFTEANEYLTELKENAPDVYDKPAIQKLEGDLQSLIAKEDERRNKRAELLATAREKGLNNATFTSVYEAEKLLPLAFDLSKNDGEKSEVKQLEFELNEKETELQATADDGFIMVLDAFVKKMDEVDRGNTKQLQDLIAEGEQLLRIPRVSPEQRNQVPPLVTKLKTWVSNAKTHQQQQSALAAITGAVGDPRNYQKKLQEFAAIFSTTSRAEQFQRVARDEVDLWLGHQAWSGLAANWQKLDLTRVAPDRAKILLAEANALLADHGGFPGAVQLREFIAALEAVVRRDEGGSALHRSLLDTLNQTLVADLKVAETKGGAKYYFQIPPKATGKAITIFHMKGFDPDDTQVRQFTEQELANPRKGAADSGLPLAELFDWQSPQSQFRAKAVDQLARLDGSNWEGQFYLIIDALQGPQYNRIDPVLKYFLMDEILKVARQGSRPLEKAFAAHVDVLGSTPIDTEANWLLPGDPQGDKARDDARRLLLRLPPLKDDAQTSDVNRRIADDLAQLRNPDFGPGRTWVGWLGRDTQGETWEFNGNALPEKFTRLFVLHPLGSGVVQYTPIGEIRNGKAEIDQEQRSVFVEGRPVYASQ